MATFGGVSGGGSSLCLAPLPLCCHLCPSPLLLLVSIDPDINLPYYISLSPTASRKCNGHHHLTWGAPLLLTASFAYPNSPSMSCPRLYFSGGVGTPAQLLTNTSPASHSCACRLRWVLAEAGLRLHSEVTLPAVLMLALM